jgi:membrane-bound metal-dependent hydrolase YbcI (DUF457 family)
MMALFGTLSMLPDIDYLWSLRKSPFFGGADLHGQHTHSLGFAVAVSLLVGATVGPRLYGRIRTGLFSFLAVSSHILLDLLCRGRSNALRVFWPVSEWECTLPLGWQPLKAARYDGSDLLKLMLFEALLGLPILIWAFWPRAARSGEQER